MDTRSPTPGGVDPAHPDDPRRLGPFRLLGRLGSGGMGTVHAALDDRDRPAAVKTVHPFLASDPDFRARFAREVKLVRRVRAVCVPRLLGADTRARIPWLATEYVPGPTLDTRVRESGPLTGERVLAFALGTAEALVAVHAAGVVHRDLKPGNVILSPDGPRVLDFGIARAIDGTALTRTGGLVGTPGWISPEQYRGAEPAPSCDVFAWGALVVHAATGRGPFGDGASDVVVARVLSEPPSLDGVPERLRGIVARALDKEPGNRPDAGTLHGEVAAAFDDTSPGDVTRVMRRHWAGAVGGPAADWVRYAPPRPGPLVRHRRPLGVGAAALAVATAAGLGAYAAADGGGEGGQGGGSGAAAEAGGDSGEVPQEYRDLYEDGTVVVEAASDTEPVLVRSLRPAAGEGEGLDQLRITFEEIHPDEFYQFSVTLALDYLPGHGSLRVHSGDFLGVAAFGPRAEAPDLIRPANSGVVAALDAGNPTARVHLTFDSTEVEAVHYLPEGARDRARHGFDLPPGFCVAVPTEPGAAPVSGTDAFIPHDLTSTGGPPVDSCAYSEETNAP